MALIELDPVTHVYRRLDTGRVVPSVSSILRKSKVRDAPFGAGSPAGSERAYVMERALKRGTEVHRLARAIDETGDVADAFDDYFDPAVLLPETVNYVSAYQKFLDTSGYVPLAWETLVYHQPFNYAGRVDGVGWLQTRRIMIDRKTDSALHRAVWLQLSFYRLAWDTMFPDEPIHATYAVKLQNDMDFRLVRNPIDDGYKQFVSAALWMARWHDLRF